MTDFELVLASAILTFVKAIFFLFALLQLMKLTFWLAMPTTKKKENKQRYFRHLLKKKSLIKQKFLFLI